MASTRHSLILQDKTTGVLIKINKAMYTTLGVMKKLGASSGDLSVMRAQLKSVNQALTDINLTRQGINKTTHSIERQATAWEKVKKSLVGRFALGTIVANFAWQAIYGIKNLIDTSIMYASSLVEVQNIVDVAYGKSSAEVDKWAKATLSAYGINELNAKNYAGTLASQLQASGIAQKRAGDMAMSLTGLAGDIASFYNLPIDVAFSKLRSGMSGMVIPLRKLGIDLTVATLQEYAYTVGIKKKWKEMTQAEKVMIRYDYVMKKTGAIQGDFVKTQYTFANQLRLLQQQWIEFTGQLSAKFLPVLNLCLIGLNGTLDALRNLTKTLHPLIPIFTGLFTAVSVLATTAFLGWLIPAIASSWVWFGRLIKIIIAGKGALIGFSSVAVLSFGAITLAIAGTVWALHKFGISYTDIFSGFIGVLYSVKQAIIECLTFPLQASADAFAKSKWKLEELQLQVKLGTAKGKQKEAIETALANGKAHYQKYNKASGRIGNQYQVGLEAGRELAQKMKLQMHFGNNGKGFGNDGIGAGVPTGKKSDPLYTKMDENDIKAMVEVAKVNYINKYVKMQPNLTANFGDVRESADVNQIMGHLSSILEEAHNSAIG